MSSTVINIIIIVVLVLCVGAALLYIRKHKKNGIKCVGCPYASSCSGACSKGVEKKQ